MWERFLQVYLSIQFRNCSSFCVIKSGRQVLFPVLTCFITFLKTKELLILPFFSRTSFLKFTVSLYNLQEATILYTVFSHGYGLKAAVSDQWILGLLSYLEGFLLLSCFCIDRGTTIPWSPSHQHSTVSPERENHEETQQLHTCHVSSSYRLELLSFEIMVWSLITTPFSVCLGWSLSFYANAQS